jgi:ABC-2 type transport system permease protein
LGPIGHVPLVQSQLGLLYHLIAIHSLWYAPLFAYLLLVSAWARRAPILWAALPPLTISILEKLAFNSSHFIDFLKYRFGGGPSAGSGGSMDMLAMPISGTTLGHFLASPGLWGGLLVTALFLAAAVQLRRYRSPS